MATKLSLQLALLDVKNSDVARRAKLSESQVSRTIHGKQKMTARVMNALSIETGLSRERIKLLMEVSNG